MRIQLELDPRDIWRLQALAEKQGVRAGDVLRGELEARRTPASVRERVRTLVTAGECDADIAATLAYLPGSIATIRRGLGLPANRRYPRSAA